MPEVVIYTKSWCGYCFRAKRLLDAKNVAYQEIDVESDPELEAEMIERSGGGRTVPQIFFDGVPVGGSDELIALAVSGRLDRMLAGEAANSPGSD